jgi:3-methyladenine DNA glycosylase Tag
VLLETFKPLRFLHLRREHGQISTVWQIQQKKNKIVFWDVAHHSGSNATMSGHLSKVIIAKNFEFI